MNKTEFIRDLFSQADKREDKVLSNHIRLAHYTTESTLMKIIKNKEIWLRNTSRMNDSLEIKYGVNGLARALNKNGNTDRFKSFLTDVFDGNSFYINPIANFILERQYIDHHITYIACLSEHHAQPDDHEEKYGRLSMWRAYGNRSGVALLFKPSILTLPQGVIYFSPVEYWEQDEITRAVTDKIKFLHSCKLEVREYIRQSSNNKNEFFYLMIRMLLFAIISIKHPSFAEEREWRLIYHPTASEDLSHAGGIVEKDVVDIGGSLEEVYKIDLSTGEYELGKLLDSIMIGPNNHPFITKSAIEKLLKDEDMNGIPVIPSNVPLIM